MFDSPSQIRLAIVQKHSLLTDPSFRLVLVDVIVHRNRPWPVKVLRQVLELPMRITRAQCLLLAWT